jgi:hypothetical protein
MVCFEETSMLRRLFAALVVLFVLVGFVLAAEFKGKITNLTTNKKTGATNGFTVKDGDKEETFRITKKTTITKDGNVVEADKLAKDQSVTVTYVEKVDKKGKTVKQVSEVKITNK